MFSGESGCGGQSDLTPLRQLRCPPAKQASFTHVCGQGARLGYFAFSTEIIPCEERDIFLEKKNSQLLHLTNNFCNLRDVQLSW